MADKQTQERDRTWVSSLLASAQAGKEFGTLTIKVEAGEVKRVEWTKSLIPPSIMDRSRQGEKQGG